MLYTPPTSADYFIRLNARGSDFPGASRYAVPGRLGHPHGRAHLLVAEPPCARRAARPAGEHKVGATPTADTDGIPTGHDTSNPIGLLAATRTAPAIRPRVETPPSHRQSRSEQRNEQNPGHVAMSDAANNNQSRLTLTTAVQQAGDTSLGLTTGVPSPVLPTGLVDVAGRAQRLQVFERPRVAPRVDAVDLQAPIGPTALAAPLGSLPWVANLQLGHQAEALHESAVASLAERVMVRHAAALPFLLCIVLIFYEI